MVRLLLVLVFASTLIAVAQEIECTVQVNYEGVSTTHKDLLQNFAADVSNYVNNYQWGPEKLEEKVKCTLNIFIQSATGENRYLAQVFVGSQRPIFGAKKNTAVLRLLDEAWEFTYLKDRPINHNLMSFNDLASFLDFYAYTILGCDYDTYENLSGTPWFQKATDVARLGQSAGQKGWQQVASGYSRTQFIKDLQNPTLEPIRRASYLYHFGGLDSLAIKPERAYANFLGALELIGVARKRTDPRNLVIKTFFDTKYLELADIFKEYPDRNIYLTLGKIDPFHQTTYEEYRQKK
jgi:hypothetical protein